MSPSDELHLSPQANGDHHGDLDLDGNASSTKRPQLQGEGHLGQDNDDANGHVPDDAMDEDTVLAQALSAHNNAHNVESAYQEPEE